MWRLNTLTILSPNVKLISMLKRNETVYNTNTNSNIQPQLGKKMLLGLTNSQWKLHSERNGLDILKL